MKDLFIREKFTKEQSFARQLAKGYFEKYPKDRYQTEVESWRKLQSDNIDGAERRVSIPSIDFGRPPSGGLSVGRYLSLGTRASLRRSAVSAMPAPMTMRASVALKLPGAMQLMQVPMIVGASSIVRPSIA